MKPLPLREHPDTNAELSDAVAWYARQDRGLGSRFVNEVAVCLTFIETWPEAAPPERQASRSIQVRRKGADGFPYGVSYYVRGSEVIIVAYAHEKRRPGYWRSRLYDFCADGRSGVGDSSLRLIEQRRPSASGSGEPEEPRHRSANLEDAMNVSGHLLHGKPVSDEQIQAWADEVETGCDPSTLPRPLRGRPPVGDGPGIVVPVRLDAATIAALIARAEAEGIATRSDAIRAAVREWVHGA